MVSIDKRGVGTLFLLNALVLASPAGIARQAPNSVSKASTTPSTLPLTSGSVPLDAFRVNTYAALGDSFASGPSAGENFENPNPCRRYTQAFGPQVNADPALQGDSNRKFDFIACSGSKTMDVYQDPKGWSGGKPTLSQASQLQGKNLDLVTMSIGGNDVGFVNLLDHCIYRFFDPFCTGCGIFSKDCSSDCDKAIQSTQSNIDSEDLRNGIDSAIRAIFQNAPGARLYVTLYPRFFNPGSTQCNDIQFNLGCAGYAPGGLFSGRSRILPLTQDRRNKLNQLTNNLNDQIKAAVGRAQPGNGGSIVWVDPNNDFDGHRFCEDEITEPSYRNSNIYFHPFEFSTGGTLSYIQSFGNSTDCNSILNDPSDGDWGNYYACKMAEAIHVSPNATSTPIPGFLQANQNVSDLGASQGDSISTNSFGSGLLPEFLARIFHPTINGMTAYKDV